LTIHEIDAAILDCIDPETGEVNEEQITALQMERDRKVDNVAAWILDLGGDNEKIDAEIERLNKIKKSNESKAESLKRFLIFALDGTNYKGALYRVNFRRTRALKDIADADVEKLPDEYKIVKTTVKPDKKKLKAAIDEGWNIAGVEIEERVSVTVK